MMKLWLHIRYADWPLIITLTVLAAFLIVCLYGAALATDSNDEPLTKGQFLEWSEAREPAAPVCGCPAGS